MKEFIGKTLIVVTLILSLSCSEDVNPFDDLQNLCDNLRAKIEQTQEPHEKQRYTEVYLAAKQELADCKTRI